MICTIASILVKLFKSYGKKNRNKIVEQYRFNGFITAFIKDASVCYSEHEQNINVEFPR